MRDYPARCALCGRPSEVLRFDERRKVRLCPLCDFPQDHDIGFSVSEEEE